MDIYSYIICRIHKQMDRKPFIYVRQATAQKIMNAYLGAEAIKYADKNIYASNQKL